MYFTVSQLPYTISPHPLAVPSISPATLQLSVEQYSRTPSAWMMLLGLSTCPWQDSSALDAFAFR
jgi:hypothetical protein